MLPMVYLNILIQYLQKTLNDFEPKLLILKPEYYIFFLYSLIFWIATYLFIHFFIPLSFEKKKDLYDTKTRIVSIIHATVMFWFALYDVVYNQREVCGDTNSDFQNKFFLFSCAYFVYDMITCIILDCSDKEMVFHHFMCILGYNASLGYNNSANEIVRALLVTEVTCPIMHLRMILKNYNLKHTKLHLLFDYIYIFTYILARIVYGSSNIIFTLFCWDNLFIVKFSGAFIWGQSFVFSFRMIRILIHKLREQKERNEKNISLFWITHNKKIDETEYYKRSLKKHAAYIP